MAHAGLGGWCLHDAWPPTATMQPSSPAGLRDTVATEPLDAESFEAATWPLLPLPTRRSVTVITAFLRWCSYCLSLWRPRRRFEDFGGPFRRLEGYAGVLQPPQPGDLVAPASPLQRLGREDAQSVPRRPVLAGL